MDDQIVLKESYWTERYGKGETGWDIGYVSTPIKEYIDQLQNKELKILIPGAGNAYEAEYLWNSGFKNVWVLDFSRTPLIHLQERVPEFPASQLIHADFFDHNGEYDLIIEQTFFCALPPRLRSDYVTKTADLLKPKGKLVGLLFQIPLNNDKPPFGGSKEEYLKLFEKSFQSIKMEAAYNSIPPRQGNELFIKVCKI
ncbi:MAG: SAM-dependent methyltransferase [Roseivirga sp.]|jgi:SAM-dependent methyltransferase|uniref:methyltransferase domain-containing protein n=1 Tax=Roseivirga sp. TaxID=1964215 RepID=UPI001B00C6D5|nr:methyltransferase domain-containing protein [Roseivirga sp.]MBO6494319.1 SAM-dependent methyltransferase [Roseivirga sp.]